MQDIKPYKDLLDETQKLVEAQKVYIKQLEELKDSYKDAYEKLYERVMNGTINT